MTTNKQAQLAAQIQNVNKAREEFETAMKTALNAHSVFIQELTFQRYLEAEAEKEEQSTN